MKKISLKTTELWAYNSKQIMEKKNICPCKLKRMFTHIYFPWDDSYDFERNYYSLKIQQRPLFIVQPINTHEIELILNYSDKKNLKLRICNGRHSTQLLTPDVLIDMSLMNKIKLKSNNLLYVEGGARQGQVNEFLFKKSKLNHYSHFGHFNYGRIGPELSTGSTESVGIGGICSIGGIGNMRRTFGLTCDVIEGFKITLPPTFTSKAKTIFTNSSTNPDLFWALLGGGANNFGVVSEVKLKLFEAGDLIEYSISWNWSEAIKIINLWSKTAPTRPDAFTEELNVSKNSSKLELHLQGLYQIPLNQTCKEAMKIVKSNIEYLGGEQIISHPKKYSNIYLKLVKSRVYYNFSMIQSVFVNTINSSAIVKFLEISLKSLEANVSIGIELMGGMISKSSIGCYAFRSSNYFITISSGWNQLENSASQENWINLVLSNFISNGINGSYVGFPIAFEKLNKDLGNKIYYADSYDKLLQIKNYYDPKGILEYSGTLN